MKSSLEKKIIFILSLTGFALLLVLVIFYYNTQKVKSTGLLVDHTEEVLRLNDDVLLDVLNIETDFKGYLITGDNSFLEAFGQAVILINKDIDELALITRDNLDQQLRIDSLKIATENKLIFTKQMIKNRSHDLLNETEKIEGLVLGKILIDKIRDIITNISSEEFRLLKDRKSENEKSHNTSKTLYIFILFFIAIILVLVTIIIKIQKTKNKIAEKEKIGKELILAELELSYKDAEKRKQDSLYARSLIEASLDPLVTISADGKITDVNEASLKVTGISREMLIGTDFTDYFTEPEKAQAGYYKVFENGFVADYPLTIKHSNGNFTDVLYNASVYKDEKGNVLGVFAAARDINKQKWAKDLRIANNELAYQNEVKEKRAAELIIANNELAFQNNEKEKRASELFIANTELAFQNEEKENRAAELAIANKELAFQNKEKEKRAAELIIANKELLFQNDEKEKRAGELIIANKELAFQNEEKENRAAELVIANKELAFQNEVKEKRAAELVIANKELAFQNEEKENRAAELVIANKELAFQNGEKEKRAAELGNANMELKKAKNDIHQLNEGLEQKVAVRTSQLESVNKELEAFSYSVSHDLRAPLRAVSGYANILMEDNKENLDADGISSLNAILKNSKKMGELIDDLLAFSRLGRKEVITSEINMSALVKSVWEEEMNGNINNVEFTMPELLPALGQQVLIKQVWVNLISNAIKYSKHKPKTHIEIGSFEKDKLINYFIKDSGAGFDMQYYNKLFGVFQRLHSQVEFEGTGIGLAIVQKIIQRHNGTVWAESKVNEGSCFYFSLPHINS